MEGDLTQDAVASLEVRLSQLGLLSRLRIHCVLLATLTLLFGLQIFRVYLPTVMWYLGQYLGAEGLALYGLATFSLALLARLLDWCCSVGLSHIGANHDAIVSAGARCQYWPLPFRWRF
jgi:hypothetical protein